MLIFASATSGRLRYQPHPFSLFPVSQSDDPVLDGRSRHDDRRMDESALVDDVITVFLQERRSIVSFTASMDQDVMRLGTVRLLDPP